MSDKIGIRFYIQILFSAIIGLVLVGFISGNFFIGLFGTLGAFKLSEIVERYLIKKRKG
jgi:hypothetical protein